MSHTFSAISTDHPFSMDSLQYLILRQNSGNTLIRLFERAQFGAGLNKARELLEVAPQDHIQELLTYQLGGVLDKNNMSMNGLNGR